MAPLCGSGKRGRSAKMVFCLFLFLIPITLLADKSSISPQTLEVQSRLKRLNKPAQKSIESLDGDIIDCVNIKHQPAFDHPLLKNLTIQTAPSFHLEGLSFHETKASSNVKLITQLWHLNGRCPKGTIPIRRTKEEDILRASSVETYGRKEHSSIPQPSAVNRDTIPRTGHVRASAALARDRLLATNANTNVWKPRLGRDGESSSSQIWLSNGFDTIEVGWQVNPRLYGDSKPRLFGYWSNTEDQSTGCYNLLCSGFIQVDGKLALGATVSPVSEYNGSQYEIGITMAKTADGSWWMKFGSGRVIGYWPGSLFTKLKDGASRIEWGGEVAFLTSNVSHTATQMGSGHFPSEGLGRASFFRHVWSHGLNGTVASKDIVSSSHQPHCYDIKSGESKDWGFYFYYGGPGRNPRCP